MGEAVECGRCGTRLANVFEKCPHCYLEPTVREVRVTNATTGGEKGSKLARYDLIPAGPLLALAEHYGKGAEKYADRNWEKGYDWNLSYAALNRHLWAFWDGEDMDEETQSHHLCGVLFHAMALLQFSQQPERYGALDNRPTRRSDDK